MEVEISNEEKLKIHKYMKNKQHTCEQPMDQRRNKGEIKSLDNINGNTTFQNVWYAAEAAPRRKFICTRRLQRKKISNK